MDFSNVKTALAVLPENGSEADLKQSSPYQALVASSAAITEATFNNLPTNGNSFYDAKNIHELTIICFNSHI